MTNTFICLRSLWPMGVAIALFPSVSFAQTSQIHTLEFDNIIGEENLAIQNGPLNYKDYPFVIEGKTKYLSNEPYSKGNVRYDGRQFYDIKLKYDLYLDLLVFNPEHAPPTIGVDLIKQKVDSFFILGRKFVNMDKLPNYKNSHIHGYCQKIEIEGEVDLYVKHKKTKREEIKNNKVLYAFDKEYLFLLGHKGNFHEISSMNDLQKIFPGQMETIAAYARQFKDLESSDPVLYYQKLIAQLTALSKN